MQRWRNHLASLGVAVLGWGGLRVLILLLTGLLIWAGGSTYLGAVGSMQVRISPPQPALGYTLSVEIITADPPTFPPQVRWQQPSPTLGYPASYPAFLIGNHHWRALVPTSPLDNPGVRQLEVQGWGSPQLSEVSLQKRDFPVQRIQLAPSVAGLEPTEMEMTRVNQFRQQATSEKFWQAAFVPPGRGSVTTIYGVRRYYNGVFAENYYHRGIDYAGGVGSPVVAPADGRVGLVGLESAGFRLHGNIIGIDHGQGVTSVFLHLSRIDVQEGDWVKAGQVIGGIGATGVATGPHLHWGLFVHNVSVDPVPWLHLHVP
ncbi:MAG: M23 family metallopeptidase [Cyanobacteriota bacterium]|nr:M23 family metallopeptidase [Cyanobacteriota bacterium]